ncbi:MAG TPA: efflux RND transporter periplasmic adaptor subunit [Sedimenticola thiotaurini]|uniref:Efflux RND transporter periplasmic adaptor subunit n=1 Tax=Sedimenticola thiotaurini TaxID=1543721 RepID=A0A831RPF3_9GAMM|nr:efflux RND transporter periplasmic adaptor subunit [Sedimenticola thiotaurini]
MIRWIGTALAVVLLVTGCSKEPEKKELIRPVFAVQAGTDSGGSGRSFPGRAKANQEVDLSFRVSGPLIELPGDVVGRRYRKGEVIARIDPRDYEVKLQDAEGKLERARSALKRAEGEYRRELQIYKQDPGATSKTAVDRKRDQRDQAAGEVKSLEAAVQAARDNLEYTYLKAPFDGVVTARYVDNFQDVRARQKIVRLLDQSRIQIVVDIPETLISHLPEIEDFWVVFDAFPDHRIPAKLFEVGTEASQTTRTYPVTLIMDPPKDIEILAGMAGRAYGRLKSTAGGRPVVPANAVFTPDDEKQSYVWVIDRDSGTVSRRKVTLGPLAANGVIITEGLQPGEWVATAGVHSLHEGQKVRILEKGRG